VYLKHLYTCASHSGSVRPSTCIPELSRLPCPWLPKSACSAANVVKFSKTFDSVFNMHSPRMMRTRSSLVQGPVPCSACMRGRGARAYSPGGALSGRLCCCYARPIPGLSGAAHRSSAGALSRRRVLPRAGAGPGRAGAQGWQAARRRRAGARKRGQQLPLGVLLARHERGVDRALRCQRRLRARRGLLPRSHRDPLSPRKG